MTRDSLIEGHAFVARSASLSASDRLRIRRDVGRRSERRLADLRRLCARARAETRDPFAADGLAVALTMIGEIEMTESIEDEHSEQAELLIGESGTAAGEIIAICESRLAEGETDD